MDIIVLENKLDFVILKILKPKLGTTRAKFSPSFSNFKPM